MFPLRLDGTFELPTLNPIRPDWRCLKQPKRRGFQLFFLPEKYLPFSCPSTKRLWQNDIQVCSQGMWQAIHRPGGAVRLPPGATSVPRGAEG